ncbi:MAG: hypothetical protein ACOYN5_08470 [Bacteroidales bacterium]|jgi:hypothetical protein
MVVIINKSAGKKKLNEALRKMKQSKVLKSADYSGKVQWNEDPVEYQKKLRNEW